MKKVLLLLLMTMLVLGSLTACGTGNTGQNSSGGGAADAPFQIGVIQLVEHAALDASYQGFVKGLTDAGLVEGQDFVIDFQNAQGEQANCNTIAEKFVNDKKDLILAIATPAAQATANLTTEIPILVTAVTDPADAGLVQSNEAPGTNVSGTSDLTPVAAQIDLLMQLKPDTKKLAVLYCSNESNSIFQADLAHKAADELGLEWMDATVSNSNEVQQVVQSLVGKVDAIYAPTDNMIAAGMATVAMVANEAGIPVICGEEGMVSNGGIATLGINYFKLGELTGAQAVKVLVDGEDVSKMPIEYLKDFDLTLNQNVADQLGISIPEDIASKANIVG